MPKEPRWTFPSSRGIPAYFPARQQSTKSIKTDQRQLKHGELGEKLAPSGATPNRAPLGPWLYPGKSLRRTWPFYWDPSSRKLLVKTPTRFSIHRPFTNHRQFHLHSSRTTSTLPPTCYPIDVTETRIGFTRHPGPTIVQPPPTPPSSSFENFLSFQQTWVRHLLHTLDPTVTFANIFDLLKSPTSSPVAVSDGSVQASQRNFGWVRATSQPNRILLRCQGPAYGAFMDSYRAEAYSLL
jgi:hypothetical protein